MVQEWSELIVAAGPEYYRGDHSAFSEMIWNHRDLLNPISKDLHRMRLDPEADKTNSNNLISMHWTGDIGKNHIRGSMGKDQSKIRITDDEFLKLIPTAPVKLPEVALTPEQLLKVTLKPEDLKELIAQGKLIPLDNGQEGA